MSDLHEFVLDAMIGCAHLDQQANRCGQPLDAQIHDQCPVCIEMSAPTDHAPYPNPRIGDDHHGQYDPARPQDILVLDVECSCPDNCGETFKMEFG